MSRTSKEVYLTNAKGTLRTSNRIAQSIWRGLGGASVAGMTTSSTGSAFGW